MNSISASRIRMMIWSDARGAFHTSRPVGYSKGHRASDYMTAKPRQSFTNSRTKYKHSFTAHEPAVSSIIAGEMKSIKFVSKKQSSVLLRYDLIYAIETRDFTRLDSIIFANMNELTFYHISNIFSQLYKSAQENDGSKASLSQNTCAALLDRLEILCEYKRYSESTDSPLPFHAAAKINKAFLPKIQSADEITYLLWGLHSIKLPPLQDRLIKMIVELWKSHEALLDITMNEKIVFNVTFALNRLDPNITDHNKNIRLLFATLNSHLLALEKKQAGFSLVEVSSMLFGCKNFSLKTPEVRAYVSSLSNLLEKLTSDLTCERNESTANNQLKNQQSVELDIRIFTNILKGTAKFDLTPEYANIIKSTSRLLEFYCNHDTDALIDLKDLSICLNGFRNLSFDSSSLDPAVKESCESDVTAICHLLCDLFEKQAALHNNTVLNLSGIAASFCGLRHWADSMLTKRVVTLILSKLHLLADGADSGCSNREKANAYALLLFAFRKRFIGTKEVDLETPYGLNRELLALAIQMLQRDESVLIMTSREVGLILNGIEFMSPRLDYVIKILTFLSRAIDKCNIIFKLHQKKSIDKSVGKLKSRLTGKNPAMTELMQRIKFLI